MKSKHGIFVQENIINTKENAHDKKITDIAFAPDGKNFVTVSEDNTVKLWDLNFTYIAPINNTNSTIISNLQDELNKINNHNPIINWQTPFLLNSTVNNQNFIVKACVESKSEINKVQFYLNGSSVDLKKGFKNLSQSKNIMSNINCAFSLVKEIKLKKGINKLFIKVTNNNGKTTSDIYKITYLANENIEKRVALVIGNSNYKVGPLLNPSNDAKAIANKLAQLGFEVLKFEDLRKVDLKKAIDEFGSKLKGKDSGLFYYAGHGIQVDGINYLVPVDASIEHENEVEYDCINIGRVLRKMESSKINTKIVILDACRNNPFERSWSRGSQSKGLASMKASKGTFIAYATSPGETASDGTKDNGLYTEALLQHIGTPSIQIEQIFKKVRITVEQKSNNKQIPWESTSLIGDFYFKR